MTVLYYAIGYSTLLTVSQEKGYGNVAMALEVHVGVEEF